MELAGNEPGMIRASTTSTSAPSPERPVIFRPAACNCGSRLFVHFVTMVALDDALWPCLLRRWAGQAAFLRPRPGPPDPVITAGFNGTGVFHSVIRPTTG